MGRFVGSSLAFKTEFKNKQVFTSTGVFVSSSVDGSDAVRVTVLGPGANGSSSVGGAAGGFAQKTTFLKPGCAYCVTVGTSGTTTSFGSVVSATSGSGQTTAGCGIGGDVNMCGGCGASCIGYFNCCFNCCLCIFCTQICKSRVTIDGYGSYCLRCDGCMFCCLLTAASGGGAASLNGNGCNAIQECFQPGLGSSPGGVLGFCYGDTLSNNPSGDEVSCDDCINLSPQIPGNSTVGGCGAACSAHCNYTSCFHQRIFTCGPSYQPNQICTDLTVPFTFVPIVVASSGCAQCSGSPITISTCSRIFTPNKTTPHLKCGINESRVPFSFCYLNCATCLACGIASTCLRSFTTSDCSVLQKICRYVDESSPLFASGIGASGGADRWSRCCANFVNQNPGSRCFPQQIFFGVCTGMANGCFGSGGASGATMRFFSCFGFCFCTAVSCTCCRVAGCGGAGLVLVEW